MKDQGEELCSIACAIREAIQERKTEFEWYKSHINLATKQDLQAMEQRIMSAISDFATKQNAFNDRQDAAMAGLQGDIDGLVAEIAKLQGTQGQITPEDQALLDGIQARTSTISDKLDALDALTPPVVPPVV